MTVSSLACTFSGVKKDEFGTPKTLREESQKEFKKETRRVAIKGFDSGTNKQQIEALLSSYHTETIHTDKSGESCKVLNLKILIYCEISFNPHAVGIRNFK